MVNELRTAPEIIPAQGETIGCVMQRAGMRATVSCSVTSGAHRPQGHSVRIATWVSEFQSF